MILLFFLIFSLYTHARPEIDWQGLSQEQIRQYFHSLEKKKELAKFQQLAQAKHQILIGEPLKAQGLLKQLSAKSRELKLLKRRAQSYAAFLVDDFERSFSLLDDSLFREARHFEDICLLKTVTAMMIKTKKTIFSEYQRCRSLNSSLARNNFFWMDFLMAAYDRRPVITSGRYFNNYNLFKDRLEDTRLWLKAALVQDAATIVAPHLSDVIGTYYQSSSIRELMALIYYQLGDTKKAQDFLEGLDSLNAELIRGMLYLREDKDELAYGRFRLALKKRPNSSQALQRALPLAWKLGRYADALSMLDYVLPDAPSHAGDNAHNKMSKQKERFTQKKLMASALLFAQERFALSLFLVKKLTNEFGATLPRIVHQTLAANALFLNKDGLFRYHSAQACALKDGLSCWLQMQKTRWVNLSKILGQEELETSTSPFLSAKSSKIPKPFQDEAYIDQKDIEELDRRESSLESEEMGHYDQH